MAEFQPRTKGIYYPQMSLKVYVSTVPILSTDNKLVNNLPVCYTWRKHNVIVLIWPPLARRPYWRIKCSDGTASRVTRLDPRSQIADALEIAQTMMSELLIYNKSHAKSYETWKWKVFKFMSAIVSHHSDGMVLYALHGD